MDPAHNRLPPICPPILEALDELLHFAVRQPLDFLGTTHELRGLRFEAYAKYKRHWKRPRTCVVPGCTQRSVAASHALQRSGPLQLIAEDGHVLTPSIDPIKEQMAIRPIGVAQAATFAGFCTDHEQLFADFEREGSLNRDRHIMLQVFRTICREVVAHEVQMSHLQHLLHQLDSIAVGNATVLLKRRLGETVSSKLSVTRISTPWLRKRRAAIHDLLQEEKDIVACLKADYLVPAYMDIKGSDEHLSHWVLRIAQPVPVCLAGMGNFWIRDKNGTHCVRAFLNVWPTHDRSVVCISAKHSDNKCLRVCLGEFLGGQLLGPLTLIETWMVNGTDHWFIAPSVWAEIPTARRERILGEHQESKHHIGVAYGRSIFDGLRAEMLRRCDDAARCSAEYRREANKLRDTRLYIVGQ